MNDRDYQRVQTIKATPATVATPSPGAVVDLTTCAVCGRRFKTTARERQAAITLGLPLWSKCGVCRPSRRQIVNGATP